MAATVLGEFIRSMVVVDVVSVLPGLRDPRVRGFTTERVLDVRAARFTTVSPFTGTSTISGPWPEGRLFTVMVCSMPAETGE